MGDWDRIEEAGALLEQARDYLSPCYTVEGVLVEAVIDATRAYVEAWLAHRPPPDSPPTEG